MKQILGLFLISFPVIIFAQQKEIALPQPAMHTCLTADEIRTFRNEIIAAKAAYYATHTEAIPKKNAPTAHLLLGWPMRANSDYDFQYNYFNLQNYVDQTRPGSGVQDYRCNDRTYDGHDAQDINLYPFWWRMMDNNHVMAVAAAPGTILRKASTNFDRNCTQTGSANYVSILHADGTVTSYLHLKANSLTTKNAEEEVVQGEFLGFIGSSGRSSNPHLHFSVYDPSDNLIEPFFEAGQCNNLNSESWWQNQRAYWEPQINRLMTHSAPPTPDLFCPSDEVVNAKNQFGSGEVIYTGMAFMDGQNGDEADCTLSRPDGTTHSSWTVQLNQTNSRQYKTNAFLLPSGNTGTWTFRATYRGRVYAHFFTVGCKDNESPSGSGSGNDGYITGNYISSTKTHTGGSNSKVLYQAENYIELKPGFEARAGIHFKARIKPCTYAE